MTPAHSEPRRSAKGKPKSADQLARSVSEVRRSVVVVAVVLTGGLYFFRWQEDRFADVV